MIICFFLMHLNIKQLIILFPSGVCGVAFRVVFFGLLHLGHSEQQSWETKKGNCLPADCYDVCCIMFGDL